MMRVLSDEEVAEGNRRRGAAFAALSETDRAALLAIMDLINARDDRDTVIDLLRDYCNGVFEADGGS